MNQISAFYQKIDEAIKPGKRPLVVESAQGAYLTIESKKKLNFCSNNYLGFASNPRLKKAATDAIKKYGVGPGAVRALSGTNTLHIALEENLAKFKKAEAALVVQGGYIANLAAIQTLLGKEDIVISDELNHASIIDAIRLAQIKNKYIYKHRDMGDLEKVLNEIKELRKTPKSDNELPIVLIVTDGVFSMDGDGRGIVDHFNLHGEVDIDVGTLSKAFGVMGGFISGKRELIEYYRQKARQFLFSTGLTVPDTAALIEAVKILEESDKLVKKLWNNANYLKRRFKALSFDTGESETPITPVMLGDENVAIEFSAKLLENGVFATPIKFPMVPKGKARIRVM
ncbi:MAG: aminotransferase class I/II-fold pyridoxal phosphate-dependent enzyme, partial [Candidatus Levybacteria bacterium]|nr:aminotransferase class I/II-fold pyridoxal phosphate-dependent enzyme [Candidatus Levybacteria bacterium]